jgi:pimeloyl-ACP methyl ester carboxylesterase
VFLGTVQIGRLPAWIARHSPAGVAVIQGAPHWIAKADGSDLFEFMQHFTESTFRSVLNMNRTNKLRIIVDSQAAPNVLELFSREEYSKLVESIVLVQPLGLNPRAFEQDRIATFKKRVGRNLRYQLPFLPIDRRLAYNHGQILRMVGYSNARSNAQYDAGLTSNSTAFLKKLYALHIPITIICGEKDTLFPSEEIQDNLRKNDLGIPVIVIGNTPHSPLPSKQGMRLFNRALEISQKTKESDI